jgi:zinc protease
MRLPTIPAATLVLAACATPGPPPIPAGSAATDDRIFAMPYVQRELPNGLRVVVVRTPYPDLVTVQIPVQTGSRNEVEPGKSGFAHFFEHMMFRGTDQYPADAYNAVLQATGADSNAYTSDDLTNYHTTFSKADLEKILELEADRFKHLKYGHEQFRTEALAVKGEYLKNYANPLLKATEALREIAFTTHPYRHTTMGFLRDIEDMPNQYEYSRTFFDRWYRPEKTTVIVAGDVDPAATVKLVEKHWGDWAPGRFSVDIPAEPPAQAGAYRHLRWETPTQPLLVMGFRGPAFDARDPALPALQLLGDIHLSNTSDVYQKVVNQERWADAILYSFPERRDPSLLLVGARLNQAGFARPVAAALVDALVRARSERVSARKLADVKSAARYRVTASMDSSRGIGEVLARFVHFARTPETLNDAYRTLERVTADDLLAAAATYFVDRGRFVVTVSNDAALPELQPLPSVDVRAAELRGRNASNLAQVLLPSASPLVDVAFLFHSGAAQDPPGKKGLAALTAAMVARAGSATRAVRELDDAYFPLAARLEAQVDKEMTRFAGTVHRDNVEAWYALAREQLLTPGWRADDFARLKQQQVNAIRTDLRSNNDEELAKEVLYAAVYGPQHRYGSFNKGALRDLAAITLDDVRRFYAEHYTPANLTLGIAGGYPETFIGQLQADVARLPAGARHTLSVPPAPPLQGRRATIVQKDTTSVAVSFGHPLTVRRGDPDWVALWLARSWLGEHRNSAARLYQRIREARGLNYGSYAYEEYFPGGMFAFKPPANLGRQQQLFQVWLRPLRSNNDAVFATRAALFELQQLIERGLSPADFAATRDFLDKYVSQLLDTQSRVLGYALDSRYYGIPGFADYVREGLRQLTVDEVNRVIRKHLQTDHLQFVFVTRDAADLRRRLASDAPSPIQYNSAQPEALLAEDKAISTLPLRVPAAAITVRPLAMVFT